MDPEEFEAVLTEASEIEKAMGRTRAVTEDAMARVMSRMAQLCEESEALPVINASAEIMIKLKQHIDVES